MSLNIETKCLHLDFDSNSKAGGTSVPSPCNHYGSVSFPIYQTATYAHPGVGQSTGFDYSRLQNPTREQLEKVVAQLEGGIDAFALSSGMAAISLLMKLFKPGDHLIVDSDLYGGSIRLFDHVTGKNGINFTRANCSQDALEPLITAQTRAIYIETPTNPMMNVTDIAATAEIARKHGLLLIVDNTFMSPYFQNPLELGADVVIHSGTKYLAGHNDTLAGFIITKREDIQEKLRFLIKTTGAGLAPFDCWLTLRGIKTLAVRMEKAQKNAKKIVEWLKNQKVVTRVIYPGLPEHPGYKIQQKQARGFGAMVTFNVTSEEKAKSILNRVKLIQFAESLGGTETLITYPVTQTHADVPEELRLKNGITNQTLRLSVGIENEQDLIADLAQALK
ncbi:PLP-dependent aspartate aminotransferase family protein [Treponema sp. C6A8]|uniref:trans-sulfuration enzyme family protein n=1 Tax=Treponema sp. C6A8 TaxID=1410609 RepID=UPI000484B01F|nr:PLP-dependent aspartate aminotransferase family protein [Treponema sp. C6A8]